MLNSAKENLKDLKNISYKVVDIMRGRKQEFAEMIALEAGKPLSAAVAEIDRTIAKKPINAPSINTSP